MSLRLGFGGSILLALACESSTPAATTFEDATTAAETSSTTAPAETTTVVAESSSSTQSVESSSEGSSSSESTGINTPNLDVGSDETGTGPTEIAEVFGHSGQTLYRLDVGANTVETVGDFTGVLSGSIIDIALDADSQMYGTAFGALYSIDKTTAACTLIAQGSYPTSLSFVPAGTVDPLVEAMVGYVDAEYIRIDVDTGAITSIGALGGGLESSGDLVSVKDGPTYLTVRGDTCVTGDCLVVVDPTNGDVLVSYGDLAWAEVFGLGFWGGTVYGFARDGTLFSVEFLPNGALVTTPIDLPDGMEIEWFGAGSTTSAPPAEG